MNTTDQTALAAKTRTETFVPRPPKETGPSWLFVSAQTAGAVIATVALFTAFAWFARRFHRRPEDPSHPAFGH